MAIPIIPDVAQVQVRLQKDTGLPEDVFINTFYFETSVGGTVASAAASMADMLDAFYGGTFAPQPAPLSSMLPLFISSVRYVFYDLGDPLPRYPVVPDGSTEPFIQAAWTPGGGSGDPIPEEVALCCSFSAGNGPRRRGRVYLGPWTTQSVTEDGGGVRPTSDTMARIALAAEDMSTSTENARWVVVSSADAGAFPVEAGWVDNAWDTQRSRGAAPTSRVTWQDGNPPT